MPTEKARQDRTTHVEGRPRGTSSSIPPPLQRDQLLANVDALYKALSPTTIEILKIEFSSKIRTLKRKELPQFVDESVDRYRLLLAFDELNRMLAEELGERNRKILVWIDHSGGIHSITLDKHESHRCANTIAGLIQRRTGVPLEVAHEILTSIVALLLKTTTIALHGLCYKVDESCRNVTITHPSST